MDWHASTGWWLLGGTLVALELLTGTFYLLMLALGAAAGAIAAHLGAGHSAQMALAALVGCGALAWWHRHSRRAATPAPQSNPDLNLDIGRVVQVAQWRSDSTARVHHRGSDWDARHAGGAAPQPGAHVIRAIEGTRLVLEAKPQ